MGYARRGSDLSSVGPAKEETPRLNPQKSRAPCGVAAVFQKLATRLGLRCFSLGVLLFALGLFLALGLLGLAAAFLALGAFLAALGFLAFLAAAALGGLVFAFALVVTGLGDGNGQNAGKSQREE